MNDHREIKLSIRLMTYNHGSFIKEAMNGIMAQKTNFPFEIVVGDDFSQDNTLDIIKEYEESEMVSIKILNRKKGDEYWNKRQKLGRLYNFFNILENCAGKFIALLDGDDYWTDPYKLQKQVNFLEKNSQYSACFTDAVILNQKTQEETNYLDSRNKAVYKSTDIIKGGGGMFPTASFFFRNIITEFPEFVFEANSGDRALSLLLTLHGDFYRMDEVTCVYRIHDGGVFSNIIHKKEKRNAISVGNIKLLQNFNEYSGFKFSGAINGAISNLSKKILINRGFHFNKQTFEVCKKLNLRDWISYLKHIILK